MLQCDSPLIICLLMDENGKLVSASEPNGLTFTVLCSTKKCLETDSSAEKNLVTVSIKGYIVVYVEGKEKSSPIPFYAVKHICIDAPKGTFLSFSVKEFHCYGVPVILENEIAQVNVLIDFTTEARSCSYTDVLVQPVESPASEKILISVMKICDCVCFKTRISVLCDFLLSASTYQYNALSIGVRTEYTDQNELTEYGNKGILSPASVSYYNLFVNGVLQPNVNYAISAGQLELLTTDIPAKNEPIILTFVTFGQNHGKPVYVTDNKYVTVSDGIKTAFTNSDRLIEYGDSGIPSPDQVSYFNLYINGTLQPKTNYTVTEGHLELTTTDVPPVGATIILESLVIKDSEDLLLKAEVYAYNAYSNGNTIYTDQEEITMYGDKGISAPQLSSYQNLFVNGVIQPQINYSVQEGRLTLNTSEAPKPGVPITLQFVRAFLS